MASFAPWWGPLLLKRAALPRWSATESFWKSLLVSTDSSSPVWRALALASFFSSLTARGCHAPSDSTARGKNTIPCLLQGSQDLSMSSLQLQLAEMVQNGQEMFRKWSNIVRKLSKMAKKWSKMVRKCSESGQDMARKCQEMSGNGQELLGIVRKWSIDYMTGSVNCRRKKWS